MDRCRLLSNRRRLALQGTFVPPEHNYGRALVPDSIPLDAPLDAPIPGTWYSIIPVLDY